MPGGAPLRLPSALTLAALAGACASPAVSAQPRPEPTEHGPVAPAFEAAETVITATPEPALTATLAAWITEQREITVRVGSLRAGGSGVVVSRDGLVLTAAHVVAGRSRIGVTWPDGTRVRGRVVTIDLEHDLATLATGRADTACAPLSAEPAPDGAWVLVTGFPGGLSGEVAPLATLGLVLGHATLPPVDDDVTPGPSVLTSAHVAPGMSGGPALDASGRLVGVAATLGGGLAPLHGVPLVAELGCERSLAARELPSVVRDPTHHEPDRAASLSAALPRASLERAAHDPSSELTPTGHASTVRFHGWGHDVLGVVVAPNLVLTLADRDLGTVAEPSELFRILSHAGARVVGPVAIRGELALVRTEGLDAPALRARASRLTLGALVLGSERRAPGLVSGLDAHPGELTPYIRPMPEGGCGTLYGMRFAASPRVEIAAALAHDAPTERGELLLDREGRPAAIHVGHHVDGLGYAVPLQDALARFADLTAL